MTIERTQRGLLLLIGLVLSVLIMVSCGQEGGKSDTDTDGGNNGPPTGDTRSSITQYQFTWTFDRDYRCGKFVNGDFWVVGPVTITAISPGWDGEKNGSMIDPLPQNLQGYDSRASYYDAGLTADLPAKLPLTLQPGSSLVSTLGLESSHATYGRSFLRTAAVLTVLETEPPADAFRPPYAFGPKPLFRFSDVDITALPILAGTAATPDTHAYMSNFQRVWLDHMEEVVNQNIHPIENMEAYSRNIAEQVGEGALLLFIDHPDRQTLLTYYLQIGIDLYHLALQHDHLWPANGGHSNGRKWPILFAGIMFDHSGMKNVDAAFGEDQQTFYVGDSDILSRPYALDCHGDTAYHDEGTVAVTSGSTQVQGVGTSFTAADNDRYFGVVGTLALNDPQEDWNAPDGSAYRITAVDVPSQTLTLAQDYHGTSQTGMSYKIGTGAYSHGWLWYGHGFSPGTYRKDYIEYEARHRGLPEWGIGHARNATGDGLDWDNGSYRRCCTAVAWAGYLLSAWIMEDTFSAKTLWNHDALFDYMDRYMRIELDGVDDEGNTFPTGFRQDSNFAEQMWDTYRDDYGCTYVSLDPVSHTRNYSCN